MDKHTFWCNRQSQKRMLTSFNEPTDGLGFHATEKNTTITFFYQECEVQLAQMDEQRRLLENNLKRSAYRLTKRT